MGAGAFKDSFKVSFVVDWVSFAQGGFQYAFKARNTEKSLPGTDYVVKTYKESSIEHINSTINKMTLRCKDE